MNMSEKSRKKPLAIALCATFSAAISASPVVFADSNPFGMQDLGTGYMQLAEGKCGEGKCGEKMMKEGKCGDKMKKEGKCGDKMNMEGKCGDGKAKKEGKCGDGKVKKEGKCGDGKVKKEGKCGANKSGESMGDDEV
jgi:uncharacterized low-complexity protein